VGGSESTIGVLPVVPDPTTLELLLRATAMLRHAESHVSLPAAVDRMVAIHGLDNAVESLVRLLRSHFTVDDRDDDSALKILFKGLSRCLDERYGYILRGTSLLLELRALRNFVQHQNLDPATDIRRFQTAVDRFFHTCSADLLGCDLDTLSLAHLIRDEEVRSYVVEAERYLDEGEYLLSIVASRDAFENMYRLYLRSYPLVWNSFPAVVMARKDSPWLGFLLESMNDEVSYLSAGLDIRRQRRFEQYLRCIPSEHTAERKGHTLLLRDWTREDAEFCYRHSIETVRRWEENLLEPVQGPKPDDWFGGEYTSEQWLGPVSLHEYASSHFYVSATGSEDVYVYEVDEDGKQALEELEEGRKYQHTRTRLRHGELDFERDEEVTLEKLVFILRTNHPPRWQAVLWLNVTPLSTRARHRQKDGTMEPNISLSSSPASEIASEPGFDETAAHEIIEFRRASEGRLSESDVYRIPNLSDSQREWIVRMWRD